jgi:cytochrome oxidase Cu insertion factor (SCO1/SenC/PrrC family)
VNLRARIVGWTLGLGVIAVALAAGWLTLRTALDRAPTGGSATVAAGSLDDLLMDLQLVPLEGQSPKPFALSSLDGRRVALADLAGRPALLYFWATW